jgi:hypothetical protein
MGELLLTIGRGGSTSPTKSLPEQLMVDLMIRQHGNERRQ